MVLQHAMMQVSHAGDGVHIIVGAVLPSAPTIIPHHRVSLSFGQHWMLLSAPHRTAPHLDHVTAVFSHLLMRSAACSLHDAIIEKFATVRTQRLGASLLRTAPPLLRWWRGGPQEKRNECVRGPGREGNL